MPASAPFVVKPGDGQTITGPAGGPLTFKARGEQTDGALIAFENVIAPGDGPPLHVHANEDEAWYLLEGELRFRLGDETASAPAGSFVFVPRGVPHCFKSIGELPTRILVLFTPAGMEQFFDDFATLPTGPVDPKAFADLGSRVGMQVVGPPLPGPAKSTRPEEQPMTTPSADLDVRFSDPAARPTSWADAARVLEEAELYWLTTVRADRRPHVTPLIGVAHGATVHFCTGLREQKARNLEHHDQVAITTGGNRWAQGLDVVVEGRAVRERDTAPLQELADAYEAKYGSAWHFDVGDGEFRAGDDAAAVFRIQPTKVLAFAKEPHAQTTFRF